MNFNILVLRKLFKEKFYIYKLIKKYFLIKIFSTLNKNLFKNEFKNKIISSFIIRNHLILFIDILNFGKEFYFSL